MYARNQSQANRAGADGLAKDLGPTRGVEVSARKHPKKSVEPGVEVRFRESRLKLAKQCRLPRTRCSVQDDDGPWGRYDGSWEAFHRGESPIDAGSFLAEPRTMAVREVCFIELLGVTSTTSSCFPISTTTMLEGLQSRLYAAQ